MRAVALISAFSFLLSSLSPALAAAKSSFISGVVQDLVLEPNDAFQALPAQARLEIIDARLQMIDQLRKDLSTTPTSIDGTHLVSAKSVGTLLALTSAGSWFYFKRTTRGEGDLISLYRMYSTTHKIMDQHQRRISDAEAHMAKLNDQYLETAQQGERIRIKVDAINADETNSGDLTRLSQELKEKAALTESLLQEHQETSKVVELLKKDHAYNSELDAKYYSKIKDLEAKYETTHGRKFDLERAERLAESYIPVVILGLSIAASAFLTYSLATTNPFALTPEEKEEIVSLLDKLEPQLREMRSQITH